MRTRARDGAFTLIEIMIAVAVLALMMVVAWGSVVQTMNAKRQFEGQQDRFREARAAMQRIVKDLEAAYLSANEDRTLLDTRTYFLSEGSGDIMGLRFSAFAHQRLFADANESDQAIISYYAAYDREKRTQQNLMRRETRRMGNEKAESLKGEADVLFSNVTRFELAFFDVRDNEWKETWTTQGAEGSANRLPDRVRVTLAFPDDAGKEVVLTSQAKLNLREVLQFYAN